MWENAGSAKTQGGHFQLPGESGDTVVHETQMVAVLSEQSFTFKYFIMFNMSGDLRLSEMVRPSVRTRGGEHPARRLHKTPGTTCSGPAKASGCANEMLGRIEQAGF